MDQHPGDPWYIDAESYSAALAAVNIGVWQWDIASDIVRWSSALYTMFERERGDSPPTYADYLELVPPDDRVRLSSTIENALVRARQTGESQRYDLEHLIVTSNGTMRWLECRGHVSVSAGVPTRVIGTAVDITARKHAEAKIRESEERARLFSELASDYVYLADLGNSTLSPEIVVGSFERTIGMSPAEVAARGGWPTLIHPDDRAALEGVGAMLRAGKPMVSEYRITDAQGNVRWLRDSIRPLVDLATGEVTKLMGGVQDITERKRLEAQLAQAQKLEAVARLSGGIAHDFNNLLTVMLGSVAMIEREVSTPLGRESCDAIVQAARRGAELVRSLLLFARRNTGAPEVVDLREVVKSAQPMLSRVVRSDIVIELAIESARAPVHIDPGEAQLVLLNLAVNAHDAMPQGGSLRIGVRNVTLAAGEGLPAELEPGRYVELSVEDTGEGIPPEAMAHIFEPFFTTKPIGKGTGLGLAACHGVVQQAGGAIRVRSERGRGTCFSIMLPLVENVSTSPSPALVQTGGSERILLVEDEKMLQRLFARSLREHGYDVLVADTAEQALPYVEDGGISLLLSDVVLPGMHGTVLAERARARWPALKVLLMSGYTSSPSAADVSLLRKPFTVERLLKTIRDLLDPDAASERA
ncbi:MAG TPA: PAS domain-containing protein [Kofleriaceae bacterium]